MVLVTVEVEQTAYAPREGGVCDFVRSCGIYDIVDALRLKNEVRKGSVCKRKGSDLIQISQTTFQGYSRVVSVVAVEACHVAVIDEYCGFRRLCTPQETRREVYSEHLGVKQTQGTVIQPCERSWLVPHLSLLSLPY